MKTVCLGLISKLTIFSRSFGYQPHPAQFAVHCSPARFRIVAAGARGGKSMLAGGEGAYRLMLPNQHIWYVSSVYELADKEFDWTIEFLSRAKMSDGTRVIDHARLANPARGSRRIEFPWGSWAETKSSQKPETLLGEELNLLIIGEASQLSRSAWDRQLYARLGPRQGGVFAISTPNWDSGFFRDLYDRGQSEAKEDREYRSWKFSVLANPTFPVEEYEKAKQTLDEKVFAEQYDGEFTSRKGHVFSMFCDANIFSQIPEPLPGWPVFRCWHHEKNSYNNPVVCLLVAVDEERNLWVYDEYYQDGVLVTDVIAEMRERTRGRRVIGNLSDYRNPTLAENLRKNCGSTTTNDEKRYPQKHATVRRLQVLQTDLKVRQDNTSKIRIYKDCQRTIENFQRAKWPEPKSEESEMAEVELPTTRYMAAPLALSYLCTYLRVALGENVYQVQGLKNAK